MSTLSERFESLPAPSYAQMPIKANGNLAKRNNNNNKKHNNNNNNNGHNIMYDEAIIAAEPQIIRPNVSNLIMNKPNHNNKNKNQNRNRNQNRNNNQYQYQNQQPRGRGFKNNNYNNNNYNNNRQNQQQMGGYKSYRTSNGFQKNINSSPYKRPNQSKIIK